MAQQASNAQQREPSMDEILASIRRIIEESEPERAKADLSAIEHMANAPAAIGPAANDVARAEIPKVEVEAPVVASVQPDLPKSLIDDPFAGILSSSQADADHAYSQRFDAEPLVLDPELEAAFSRISAETMVESQAPEVELNLSAPEPQADPFIEAMGEAVSTQVMDRSKPILSELTGRQVAASFGDLAEAFATNRNRRLDEVAEDMLRPMLQEWLDNNLPVLVERLVREEIERVARGG